MYNFLIFVTASASILLCFLLLLNKVPERFKKMVFSYAVVFFLLFCASVYLSPDVKHFTRQMTAKPDSRDIEEQAETKEDVPILKKEQALLNVPIISQLPELPRGCEVTSLAMLLQHAGINTGKMELAQLVKKNPTRYQRKNGQVYFGHPNSGFVGDMYNINNPGYGVYHKPIKELADSFLPDRVVDLTGKDFSELEKSVSNGIPVWIITNTWYSELPAEQFQTWDTPAGKVNITYRLHSVVITGYDQDYVYFNDPLTGEKNRKVPRQGFIDAWVQMGKQAITYL
ncbi:hypothetical protein BTO30_11015 [Domibacillus antri]|uniref:Peptidase C39-like domain-containing protein n=1 Tax=Domibacillus antri TaxID=1714264 RepID=A0A1Q8Q4J5_9BACI|nr:C39 family peptidase [Domibacillus antri]OLN22270.1 hypothetical protein BTO30_11015 [Domibacillus antri]